MSGVASVIDSNDPDEIDRIIEEGIPDPVGSFYRFSLARSQLRRKKKIAKCKLKNCDASLAGNVNSICNTFSGRRHVGLEL